MDDDHVAEGEHRADERGERGAGLVEYALLVALIAVACIGSLRYFGDENSAGLDRSSSCIVAAMDKTELPSTC